MTTPTNEVGPSPIDLARSDPRLAALLAAVWGDGFVPLGPAVGLCVGGDLVAAGCYAWHGLDATLLHSAVVRPDHRGRGLHGRLVRLRAEKAVAAGRPTLYACAWPDNAPAVATFRRAGFAPCGSVPGVTVHGSQTFVRRPGPAGG